jgi:hypothetical protein
MLENDRSEIEYRIAVAWLWFLLGPTGLKAILSSRSEFLNLRSVYLQRDFHWSSHSIGEMISIAFEEKNPVRNTMIMQTQLQESYRSGPSTKWVKVSKRKIQSQRR